MEGLCSRIYGFKFRVQVSKFLISPSVKFSIFVRFYFLFCFVFFLFLVLFSFFFIYLFVFFNSFFPRIPVQQYSNLISLFWNDRLVEFIFFFPPNSLNGMIYFFSQLCNIEMDYITDIFTRLNNYRKKNSKPH